MNIIYKQMKFVPVIVENLLQITRNYAAPKKLPVTWVEPKKVSCISKEKSGDGGLDLKINSDTLLNRFEHSKELEDADELTKRVFTIGFNHRRELVKLQGRRARQLVARHKHDDRSMECRIAHATVRILQFQEHQEKFRKNIKSKVVLKELIEKRKKWLKKLRTQDYPRFEYLLEKLNLVYHPHPEDDPFISKNYATKRLLNKYCDELIKKKIDDYRKELEDQQKDFFKEKAEKLEFIRNEEISCGVTPSVTEEEIQAAKQKAASFV